jgi:DNA invertase Pin-like site-specific DNA recombinase
MPETVEARATRMSVTRQFAAEVAAMAAKGASVNSISRALRLSWETVRAALDGAKDGAGSTGLAPTVRTVGENFSELPLYVRIADEVARRRDAGREKFREIAEALGVSQGTVARAYDWKHREDLVAAAGEGHAPDRGRIPHLGAAVHQEVVRLLEADEHPREIAAKVGCSVQTVYRARRALEGPPDAPKAERIADEVARRRDEGGEEFAGIAAALGVCRRTVRRAYDLKHPEEVLTAAGEGRAPDRGAVPRLGAAKHREIHRLIGASRTAPEIAGEVGCGVATVYRARKALKKGPDRDHRKGDTD